MDGEGVIVTGLPSCLLLVLRGRSVVVAANYNRSIIVCIVHVPETVLPLFF